MPATPAPAGESTGTEMAARHVPRRRHPCAQTPTAHPHLHTVQGHEATGRAPGRGYDPDRSSSTKLKLQVPKEAFATSYLPGSTGAAPCLQLPTLCRDNTGSYQPQKLWGFLCNQHYHIPPLGPSLSPGLQEEWEGWLKERGDKGTWTTVAKRQTKSPPAAQRKTSGHRGFPAAALEQGVERWQTASCTA